MKAHRPVVVLLVIAGLICGGCQSSDPQARWGSKVVEIRPEWKPVIKPAPYSAVYVLWAWEPIPRSTTGLANRPRKLLPGEPWEEAHQIDQTYTRRGSPIGFRRHRGELFGIIGSDLIPLNTGHYIWRMLPGDPNTEADERNAALGGMIGTAITVVVVGAIVLVVGWAFHEDRHDHDVDVEFNDN